MKFSLGHPNPGKCRTEKLTKISRQISRHLWQRKTEKHFTSALLQGSCSDVSRDAFSRRLQILSGPVLCDTARLSQRYPRSLRAMGFLVSQHGQLGFLSISPSESMRSEGAIPPPPKGYLSDTGAIPYENEANGCDTPLCDTISKRYCAIGGGYLALGR